MSTILDFDDDGSSGSTNTHSFIGVTVAIAGNVLISLALNIQKLAHRRLENQFDAEGGDTTQSPHTRKVQDGNDASQPPIIVASENQALLNVTDTNYNSIANPKSLIKKTQSPNKKIPRTMMTRNNSNNSQSQEASIAPIAVTRLRLEAFEGDGIPPDPTLNQRDRSTSHGHDDAEEMETSTDYLKSKLWWFGFCLMNIGEIGNFMSYGFAPASVVAPLGAFALIANCFFAPVILQERFNKNDLLGMALAIFGAATIVASAKPSSPHLSPIQLQEALSQIPFLVYAIITIVLLTTLMLAGNQSFGQRWVMVDVGVCALFGGFTVLSTKALSTLLSREWLQIFKEWITYPLIIVLAGTGVGQIKYLNRALIKFDAKQVIPIQFVLFNLSAIVGSAILFGDFQKVNFHQFITFLYGCGATFIGVYLLTISRTSNTQQSLADAQREPGLTDIPEETNGGESRATPVRVSPVAIVKRRQSRQGLGLSPAQYLLIAAPVLSTHTAKDHPGSPERFGRDRRGSQPSSRPRSVERPPSINQR